ncbi:unnamed protein product [Clonostachys byssicola]|uniref:Uncharacterized protein n=1 Tax=Clonostachys byssicola TaxID=160290 RepID=A0A9N9USN2_9HYPO|nr:unnamed protein product [Clonostachys byssicola]
MFSTLLEGLSNLIMSNEDTTVKGGEYRPKPGEIVALRNLLARETLLPIDVIGLIFDFAEYWAHSSNEIDFPKEIQGPLIISGSSARENQLVLRSFPVGFSGFREKKSLAEVLAYDRTEVRPLELARENEPEFFKEKASYAMPKLVHPVRRIVFTIKSRDQGWGGAGQHHGTYNTSWTWFDVGLERFDASQTCDPTCSLDLRYESPNSTPPALPLCALRPIRPRLEPQDNGELAYHHPLSDDEDGMAIQHNILASRQFKEHIVTWDWQDKAGPNVESLSEELGRGPNTMDGSFVRGLKLGDVITVWGKARFPGWANHVERVQIDVFWAV